MLKASVCIYMIVEPIKDKADGDMGEKVKVEYGTDHLDYLYGEGRKVVIYFEGKPEETTDGMKLVKSDDISTEGFREFELEIELSDEKQKKTDSKRRYRRIYFFRTFQRQKPLLLRIG